jgi:hypothetical protein
MVLDSKPTRDTTTAAGQFADGFESTLGNVQHAITEMERRINEPALPGYVEMRDRYRGMVAAWRVCEAALVDAMGTINTAETFEAQIKEACPDV